MCERNKKPVSVGQCFAAAVIKMWWYRYAARKAMADKVWVVDKVARKRMEFVIDSMWHIVSIRLPFVWGADRYFSFLSSVMEFRIAYMISTRLPYTWLQRGNSLQPRLFPFFNWKCIKIYIGIHNTALQHSGDPTLTIWYGSYMRNKTLEISSINQKETTHILCAKGDEYD